MKYTLSSISRFTGTILLVVAGAFLAGCERTSAPNPSSDRVSIVASFFPLYDFARVLGGEDFDVACLTPPGGDPHAMDASPQVARTLADAQLALLLGFGMDGWVEKLAASESQVRVVFASRGLEPMPVGEASLAGFAKDEHDTPDYDHSHDLNEADPHVWLDPLLAQHLVRQIAEAMAALSPEHREAVFARRDAFLRELVMLDEAFSDRLADVKRREVVTFHGAFAYLFARYRLKTVGVVEQFPGDEPSAAYLRELVDLMRQLKMNVIFAEPQLSDRPAQVIAREIDGRVERLDPCETILFDHPSATYLERQRANLEVLSRVLAEP